VLLRSSLVVALVAAPALAVQTVPGLDDFKRYRLELAPTADATKRLESIRNVAFFDSEPTTRLLVEALGATFDKIDKLEAKRADVDAKLDKLLREPIAKAGRGGPAVNYVGVDELQAQQRSIGDQINAEEKVVHAFLDALAGVRNADSLVCLMKLRPKKPPRLAPALIGALGRIDDGRVAEHLIGELNDPAIEVRLAAAAALLKQQPKFVPSESLAPLLRGEWQERSLAIDALVRIADRQAMDLLIAQTAKEQGRMLGDLCGRLEQVTGQKFGTTVHAWVDWWQHDKQTFQPKGVDVTQPMRVQKTKDDRYGSFWGVQFDSLRVVYVIDVSGSMVAAVDDYENVHPDPGKSRIELARREVKASINGLAPDAAFNVIAYSDVVIPWGEGNVAATPENKKKAFDWLDGLGAVGQTNIFDALEKAFQLSAPASSAKDGKQHPTTGSARTAERITADTILFMSDGGPTCGRTTDCNEILAQVKEWNQTKRVTIHTVGIGKQVVESFMKALATQNGGQFVQVTH
jgi:hypothetical protein